MVAGFIYRLTHRLKRIIITKKI